MRWFNAQHIGMELKQIELNRKAREQQFVDEIAAKVLVAFIDKSDKWIEKSEAKDIATMSYVVAREMLNAREVKEEQVSEPKPQMSFNGYQPTGPAGVPKVKPPRKP
jgi:hypothetical protein